MTAAAILSWNHTIPAEPSQEQSNQTLQNDEMSVPQASFPINLTMITNDQIPDGHSIPMSEDLNLASDQTITDHIQSCP